MDNPNLKTTFKPGDVLTPIDESLELYLGSIEPDEKVIFREHHSEGWGFVKSKKYEWHLVQLCEFIIHNAAFIQMRHMLDRQAALNLMGIQQ